MSSRATLPAEELARRLLAYESVSREPADVSGSALFRVCEKLRGPLGKLMGAGGFRALMSRALALAGAEIPWLLSLRIKVDGALEGLDELETNLNSRDAGRGQVVLVAQLLGLLVTFIGPALTLRLVQDIWPMMENINLNGETS